MSDSYWKKVILLWGRHSVSPRIKLKAFLSKVNTLPPASRLSWGGGGGLRVFLFAPPPPGATRTRPSVAYHTPTWLDLYFVLGSALYFDNRTSNGAATRVLCERLRRGFG